MSNFFSKTPTAVIAALYRPFLWEVSTPLMFFSAIENLLLLAFTLFVVLRRGVLNFLRTASREPLVVFALTFAFIFAFAVGISSANFGALVRLKIPMVPFFVASFVIIFMKGRTENLSKEAEK